MPGLPRSPCSLCSRSSYHLKAARDLAAPERHSGDVWNVSLDGLPFPDFYDPTLSPVYFLRMVLTGTTGGGTTFHYFNITETAVSATTTSFSAVKLPTASSTSASASTSAPNKDEGKGLSGGAIAGIAIGATLGTLAVCCLVGWMVWKQLRNRKQALASQNEKSLHEVHG